MILLIDVGNSNIVLGLMDDEKNLKFFERLKTDRDKTAQIFADELMNILDRYHLPVSSISGAVISSVVPEVTEALKAGVRAVADLDAFVLGQGIVTGIKLMMDNPSRVGADLIVDAVAATQEYPDQPLAVFDMGTATTCSVITEDKSYIGTLIMPGVAISMDALAERTSQLPHITFGKPGNILGKNTVDSMLSGMVYGNASMVDGLIDRIEKEIGKKLTVLATGGIAGLIVPYCTHDIIYDPDLLLKGLMYIYQMNSL